MVVDNLFWSSIESLVCILKPICDGISPIESDNAVSSVVPHAFLIKKYAVIHQFYSIIIPANPSSNEYFRFSI